MSNITEDDRLAFGAMIREKMAEARRQRLENPDSVVDISDDMIAAAPMDEQIAEMKRKKNEAENRETEN